NSLIKKRDEYNEEIQKVQSILENMKGNLDNDPIYEKIKILFKDSSLKPKNSDEALKLAVRRRDLGNPPRSPKKDTIGDEIIWESILNEVKDDLVFVTRDNGFFEGRLFLEREFSAKTNKKVMFKDKISSAISMIGVKLPKDVVDAETEYLKSFIPSGFTIMSDKDNYFVVSDGNKGGIVYKGYDIQNLCPNCGNYGPWNGVICMSCGMRSDPWD
ncbi:MAG: PIN domain-containing protein, partial [Bacteriovorax sp.]